MWKYAIVAAACFAAGFFTSFSAESQDSYAPLLAKAPVTDYKVARQIVSETGTPALVIAGIDPDPVLVQLQDSGFVGVVTTVKASPYWKPGISVMYRRGNYVVGSDPIDAPATTEQIYGLLKKGSK